MTYNVPNPKPETISFRLQLHERHNIEGAARRFGDGTISALLRAFANRVDAIMPLLDSSTQPINGSNHAHTTTNPAQ